MCLTLEEDEIIEVMERKDLDSFPGKDHIKNYKGPFVGAHDDLKGQGFAEYYTYKKRNRGRTHEIGAYRLTDRAYDYLENKRIAGLDYKNIKLLSEKEREYVEGRLNFKLAK